MTFDSSIQLQACYDTTSVKCNPITGKSLVSQKTKKQKTVLSFNSLAMAKFRSMENTFSVFCEVTLLKPLLADLNISHS